MNLPPFKQIGKYKVEGLISRGGMSLLYLASNPDNQEPIIIKVLLPKYLSEQDVVDRFLNEAHVISLANHPNIVRLIDSGRWEGGLFIAMEFVKGSSLSKIFQHQPYTLKRAMDVLLQVSYALSHLHAHGIVHGDLKPENILINDLGQVKVIDFGIAKLLTEEQHSFPARFVGTPIYMSPELGLERQNLSFQSDIFSLGIIAYELAIGKISHGRIALSLAPKGLQKLLQKALQPRPSDRYKNMCDFIADLSDYIKSGDLEKDKQGSDQFLEVFEKLEAIQNSLFASKSPIWHGITLDTARFETMGLNALYVEVFEHDEDKKRIIVAESPKKGPEGLIGICMLKAIASTLVHDESFFSKLLELIKNSPFTEDIRIACITVNSKEKSFDYIHNGYGKTFRKNNAFVFISSDCTIDDIEITSAEAILQKARLKAEETKAHPPLVAILIQIS
ncbi:MAG: serine/threonine protein kinase [Verrucomicrobia bacterium]|nr:serine/threonine protein kinase [Verrucomicrobiota bacterium]